jgi:hypothetical protein
MRAAGKSTEEYDKHIREYVIGFLKAKGLSDEQIREALTKNKSPLDAAEPYLGGDRESMKLANHIGLNDGAANATSTIAVAADGPAEEQPLTINLYAMNAKLAAAGLDTSPKDNETAGHGVTIQKQKTPDAIGR